MLLKPGAFICINYFSLMPSLKINSVSEKSSKEIMDAMKEPLEASSGGADNSVTKGEGGQKHSVVGEDQSSVCAGGEEVQGARGGREPSEVTAMSASDVLKQLEAQVSVCL